MSTLVLMKAFESVPARYELGMRLITFGEINQLRRSVAEAIPVDANVLDIGCGTGELLALLASRGARVTAIDKNPEMVECTRQRLASDDNVSVQRATAMEIDRLFNEAEFDVVVLSLMLSELTEDERCWLIEQCPRILKPGGILIIADEFKPDSAIARIAFSAFRLPLHLFTYLYTQIKGLTTPNLWWKIYYVIVELPLMLISFFSGEALTRPLKISELNLPHMLKTVATRSFKGGSIRLLRIQKEDTGL